MLSRLDSQDNVAARKQAIADNLSTEVGRIAYYTSQVYPYQAEFELDLSVVKSIIESYRCGNSGVEIRLYALRSYLFDYAQKSDQAREEIRGKIFQKTAGDGLMGVTVEKIGGCRILIKVVFIDKQ